MINVDDNNDKYLLQTWGFIPNLKKICSAEWCNEKIGYCSIFRLSLHFWMTENIVILWWAYIKEYLFLQLYFLWCKICRFFFWIYLKPMWGCIFKNYVIRLFIFLAIYGCNFCTGGQQAFKMLVTNVLRVSAINSVGDFVLFLGKVFVVAVTVLIGTYWIEVSNFHNFVPYFW